MKEIYSFNIDVVRETKQVSKKKQKNKETGEEEEVSVEKKVKKEIPIKIIIKEPSRRQMEEADMEYSIEMSKCIKRGILTKAMLAKKYSDSGGLLSEDDAKHLTRQYSELGDFQNKYTRLSAKPKKNPQDEKRLKGFMGKMAELRRDIVELETSYSSLFNHTADNKAQNKVILWYLVNLSHYQEDESSDIKPFFTAEDSEEKIEQYYDIDENGHEIFDLAKDKLSTFLSFWYFSSNASKQDFDDLNDDINSGNV
tara:strand:- start:2511 stop:3272 length:762 start_codon:yes stop_codon:yes gene_type:complete